MKVFITKYALTKGIIELDGEIKGDYFSTKQRGFHELFFNKEFYLTREEAVNNSEERRIKKLQSLDNQIKKLSELNFNK